MPALISRHFREATRSGCPLGPAVSAGRADLVRRDVAFAEVEEVLVRVMHVLPARAVKVATGECDLRPVLLEDQALGFENRLNAPVIVEVGLLRVDELAQVWVGVIVPVADAGDTTRVIEAQGPVRLVVREVREEGEVEIAGDDDVGYKRADLDLIEKKFEAYFAHLVLDQRG